MSDRVTGGRLKNVKEAISQNKSKPGEHGRFCVYGFRFQTIDTPVCWASLDFF